MAGTTTLNRNSRDQQAVTMDLDELIRAPCPYYFKKYQHAVIEYMVYFSHFMCQYHEVQQEKIRLLRASLASGGDEAKDAPPLVEGGVY